MNPRCQYCGADATDCGGACSQHAIAVIGQEPAGPTLDRMVAEMVLGRPYRVPSGREMQYEGTERDAFSTDLGHAWAVVEHLQPNLSLELSWDPIYRVWLARFVPHIGAPCTRALGETAPLAISRAALIALESTP